MALEKSRGGKSKSLERRITVHQASMSSQQLAFRCSSDHLQHITKSFCTLLGAFDLRGGKTALICEFASLYSALQTNFTLHKSSN